ncbi:MAG: T9SS type A sorting domain-containing protein [Flavobacterium sp.]|nr:T9SS type A sorting domain-containing protein [Flavobacterium sp.]
MKKITLILFLFIACNTSFSQNVNLYSQDDVNSFPANYPDAHSFSSITISGDDIVNLNTLSQVTEVTGDLYITSPTESHPLVDLSGLNNINIINGRLSLVDLKNMNAFSLFPNLLRIGSGNIGDGLSISGLTPETIGGFFILANVSGDLTIQNTSDLAFLNGFDSLTKVKSIALNSQASVYFIDNAALTSINSFNNLTEIASEYYFVNNPQLISLPSTPNLTVIGKSITLWNDDTILNFNGLNSLTTLGGSINVQDNNNLSSFFGLNNLTTTNGITIQNNPALSSVTDLANLITFPFVGPTRPAINISNNNVLASLTGLDNINGATIGEVALQNNPNLSICAIESFCEKIAFDTNSLGFTQVSNNATNCNSADDINNVCQLLSFDQIDAETAISIYPNPVKSVLNLTNPSPTKIVIIDVLGRIRINTIIDNGHLEVYNLEKGIYFMQATLDNTLTNIKLIKE